MSKLRALSQRYPIPFILVFVIVYAALRLTIGELETIFFQESDLVTLCSELVDLICPIAFTLLAGYGFVFAEKGFGKTFKASVGVYCMFAVSLLFTIFARPAGEVLHFAPVTTILLSLLALIGIGIREELIFRGVITNVLALKYGRSVKGLWLTMILSGFVFGYIHMANVFSGVPFVNALIQSTGAFGMGLVFNAIYLRGGNIWILALLHSLIDSTSLFDSFFLATGVTAVDQVSELNPLSSIALPVIAVALSIFLLRKSKQPEIFARLDALRAKFEMQ